MNKVTQVIVSGLAACVAFAQAAVAGDGYSSSVTVEDNGAEAGVLLLLAVGALIVIGSIAKPKPPAEPSVDAPDTTE